MDNNQQVIWRFIDSGPENGHVNMAIDEALLTVFNTSGAAPIIRVYRWNPPALSIGRFQKASEDVDIDCCRIDDVPLIRRITGGGALYHADELTYSIVCSQEHIPEAISVKESFRILTGFLLEFYRQLGLNASYAIDSATEPDRLGERTAFCFAGKETFDIQINGKKIGGNAQRRQKNIIFQHGSIPLINRVTKGLSFMKDRSPGFDEGATSLSDCGIIADPDYLKQMLVNSFCHHMGVSLLTSCLSDAEYAISQELLNSKYSSEKWNIQGELQ